MRRAGLALLGLVVACSPSYDGVDIETATSPPSAVFVNSREVEIPAGVSVLVEARVRSSNRHEFDASYDVELRSDDRNILRVEPGGARAEFILIGVRPGNTCVEVVVDDDIEDCIDTVVIPQR